MHWSWAQGLGQVPCPSVLCDHMSTPHVLSVLLRLPTCPTRVLATATSEGPFSSKSPEISVCSDERDYFPFHWMNLEGHGFGAQQAALFAKWEKKKSNPLPMKLPEPTQTPSPCRKNAADLQQTFKIVNVRKDFPRLWEGFFSTLPCHSQEVFNKRDTQQLLRESDLRREAMPSNCTSALCPFLRLWIPIFWWKQLGWTLFIISLQHG